MCFYCIAYRVVTAAKTLTSLFLFLLQLGASIIYTNWEDGFPKEFPVEQCICINPQCRIESNECDVDRKWRTCNCNHSYAIVCQNGVSYGLSALNAIVNVNVFEKLPLTSTMLIFQCSYQVRSFTTAAV